MSQTFRCKSLDMWYSCEIINYRICTENTTLCLKTNDTCSGAFLDLFWFFYGYGLVLFWLRSGSVFLVHICFLFCSGNDLVLFCSLMVSFWCCSVWFGFNSALNLLGLCSGSVLLFDPRIKSPFVNLCWCFICKSTVVGWVIFRSFSGWVWFCSG